MAVITEKELSPNAKTLWLKATSAVETRNFGYAITLIQSVLKESPTFLTGRKWLRQAELAAIKGNKGFLKGFSAASIHVMKAQNLLKKDPLAAIVVAEEILEKEPHSVQANGLLRDAGAAAEMPELVGFALETMRDAQPKDSKILHELARHYSETLQPEKAIEVYNQITALYPSDIEAIRGGKNAAARASMTSGGWDQVKEGSSYREMLKNKDEAESLEQQGRIVKSTDMIEQQLTEQYALYNENQQNLDVIRKIASLHEQKEDLGSAIEWYQWAVEVTKGSDPGLIRKVNDLSLKNIDEQIRTRETWLQDRAAERNGDAVDDETAATVARLEEEIAGYRQQRSLLQIDVARKRVERNPTDLTFRYELGEQLVKIGEYTEAIQELQKARQSPNLGVKAMNLLGDCFTAKNILNLAIKQYEEASAKLPNMDLLKKEIIYKLGLIYEKSGDKDESLAYMTQIYEVDSGYKDVASRVEGSYGA